MSGWSLDSRHRHCDAPAMAIGAGGSSNSQGFGGWLRRRCTPLALAVAILASVTVGSVWTAAPASAHHAPTFTTSAAAAANGCYDPPPYSSHATLVNDCYQPNRDGYVFDPGRGHEVTPAMFASPAFVSFYNSAWNGFDANFMFWAPVGPVTIGSGRQWGACSVVGWGPGFTHIDDFCHTPRIQGAIGGDLENLTVTAKHHNGHFIIAGCGNPSADLGRAFGPVPSIQGRTYADRNRNGARDGSEPFVGGFPIRLRIGSTVLATVNSAADGTYRFDLDAGGLGRFGEGTYVVERLGRSGWTATGPDTRSHAFPWGAGTAHDQSGWDFGAWEIPSAAIGDATVVEGTGATTTLQLPVTLDRTTGVPITVTVSTADGSAVAPGDYGALVNQPVVVPAGSTAATASVTVVGDVLDEHDEQLTVSVASTSFGIPVTDGTAVGTVLDDDTATLSVADATVVEGDPGDDRILRYDVELSTTADRDLTFAYESASGSATEEVDYDGRADTLTFPAGTTTGVVELPVLEDVVDELDETNALAFQLLGDGAIDDGDAVGTINDDDTAVVTIGDASVVEGDPGDDVQLVHLVTLSTPADRDLHLPYQLVGGTATADGDVVAVSGVLTIPALTTSGTIVVPVLEDLVDELDESYRLSLLSTDVGELGDPDATGTVIDDDTARVTIRPATEIEGDPGDDVRLGHEVVLSTQSDRPVTFEHRTVAGTATADVDYATTDGTVTFAPFQTSLVVEVPVLEDLLVEADESYRIEIGGFVNTEPDGPGADVAVGSILDDDWRQGVLSCRAQGLRLLGLDLYVANAKDSPCDPDHERLLSVDVGAPGGRLRARAITATTEQNFTIPGDVAPATGDRARAYAETAGLALQLSLLVELRADLLNAEATVTCIGGVPTLAAQSKVAGLRVLGIPVNTSAPTTINLGVLGTLRLNSVVREPGRITARALWLDLPGTLLDIVFSEATVDIHDAPCESGRPPTP